MMVSPSRDEGASADSIFRSFSDPVLLFWYQISVRGLSNSGSYSSSNLTSVKFGLDIHCITAHPLLERVSGGAIPDFTAHLSV
jgi:hypothetical protein